MGYCVPVTASPQRADSSGVWRQPSVNPRRGHTDESVYQPSKTFWSLFHKNQCKRKASKFSAFLGEKVPGRMLLSCLVETIAVLYVLEALKAISKKIWSSDSWRFFSVGNSSEHCRKRHRRQWSCWLRRNKKQHDWASWKENYLHHQLYQHQQDTLLDTLPDKGACWGDQDICLAVQKVIVRQVKGPSPTNTRTMRLSPKPSPRPQWLKSCTLLAHVSKLKNELVFLAIWRSSQSTPGKCSRLTCCSRNVLPTLTKNLETGRQKRMSPDWLVSFSDQFVFTWRVVRKQNKWAWSDRMKDFQQRWWNREFQSRCWNKTK